MEKKKSTRRVDVVLICTKEITFQKSIINQEGVLRVVKLEAKEAEDLEEKGAEVRRCKMLIPTPGKESEIWKFLKREY